jgi:hypothetical protein
LPFLDVKGSATEASARDNEMPVQNTVKYLKLTFLDVKGSATEVSARDCTKYG